MNIPLVIVCYERRTFRQISDYNFYSCSINTYYLSGYFRIMDKNLIEVYLEVKRETEKAVLCTDGIAEFWLPKSQIEIKYIKDSDAEITIPEWLAIDKEII